MPAFLFFLEIVFVNKLVLDDNIIVITEEHLEEPVLPVPA